MGSLGAAKRGRNRLPSLSLNASRGKLVVTFCAVAAAIVVLSAAALVGKHLWYLRLERRAESAVREAYEKEILRAVDDLRFDVRVYSARDRFSAGAVPPAAPDETIITLRPGS